MNDAVRYIASKRAVQPVHRESGAKALLPWNWGLPKRVCVLPRCVHTDTCPLCVCVCVCTCVRVYVVV